jgi:actin-related protein
MDYRREYMSGIILSGGNSMIGQLPERLHKELSDRYASLYKSKLIAPSTTIERKYSAWIGGTILGSLSAFHQMWISKAEYNEFGPNVVERKCP